MVRIDSRAAERPTVASIRQERSMKHLTAYIRRRSSTESRSSLGVFTDGSPEGRGFWWTFAAGLVVSAAVIVAIVQNGRHVRLHYLVWDMSVSLIVVILTTALAAVLLDEIGGLVWRHRRRTRLGRRSELEQLRARDERLHDEPPAAAATSPPAQTRAAFARPAAPDI
jgi:uncharacterized integral membrane protein